MDDRGLRAFALLTAAAVVVGFMGSAAPAADPADKYPGRNLIPWPKQVRVGEGRMTLTPDSRVVAGQKELRPLPEILAGEIASLTGLHLKVVTDAGRAGDVVLKVNKSVQAGEPILTLRGGRLVRTREGAHVLTVSDRAVVEGFDYRAVTEGSATVLQAIGQSGGRVSLPRLTVMDWPHADYCGQLVDVARQDHPVAWLRKMVEVCRFYKVRYLQLHLTDDQGWTFPSTRYPALGSKNYGAHGGSMVRPRLARAYEPAANGKRGTRRAPRDNNKERENLRPMPGGGQFGTAPRRRLG